jgi:flagellar biosynthetic protein FliQ
VALVQALTQVQEMTLVFVPKIISIFLALLVALPFMAQVLHAYMARISDLIIGI